MLYQRKKPECKRAKEKKKKQQFFPLIDRYVNESKRATTDSLVR